jgi:predicted DNA-binding protein (MmcQ/YjbR family)
MDPESIQTLCRSLPHTTENVQWGEDLVFRVGGKIYAVLNLDPGSGNRFAVKCTPERFEELLEVEGIIPAPYMARNKWVAFERLDAISGRDLADLIRTSYDLVYARLTKKARLALESDLEGR